MKQLKLNLRAMTDAEQEAEMDQNIEYWDAVRKAIGNPIAVWSISEAPLDANAIAINSDGPIRIVYDAANGGDGNPFSAEIHANPTFGYVYEVCAALIHLSGDRDHIFIEQLEWNQAKQQFELWCGS